MPTHRPLRFLRLGLAALVGAGIALILLPPLVIGRSDAGPRAVTPRGPLAGDEQAHVDLFRKA